MKKTTYLVLSLLVVLSACGSPDPAVEANAKPAGEMPEGEKIFKMNCSVCHDISTGGMRSMARLFPNTPYFDSPETFADFLREPPPTSMPAFSEEKISDKQAAKLYGWLAEQTGTPGQ